MSGDDQGGFTHFDERGQARMVDVGAKPVSERVATARGRIVMQAGTLEMIRAGDHKKGDVLAVARLAGIMAAKKTSELIPLCHPLMISKAGVEFTLSAPGEPPAVEIEATVALSGQTGVEMEALTAVSVAALTIYDMCKAVDKGMRIENVRLALKDGGRSGRFEAE